eukprot:CAMPEP_0203960974 /NCGR_PEP_ID=MMETSP0359-20131031/91528_1 /ASSEMBLY_ACC=CAM_ASM_000338 /TAXON_ID=268821 /ORGANISM="Scrippsiella Hangoei, Strain SHTV-5" /LENGTH=49 /DNA_ID=CAMNT_0050895563 /DNA_START=23 /DNA_END=172 /DNA_ORIENTATION=-
MRAAWGKIWRGGEPLHGHHAAEGCACPSSARGMLPVGRRATDTDHGTGP